MTRKRLLHDVMSNSSVDIIPILWKKSKQNKWILFWCLKFYLPSLSSLLLVNDHVIIHAGVREFGNWFNKCLNNMINMWISTKQLVTGMQYDVIFGHDNRVATSFKYKWICESFWLLYAVLSLVHSFKRIGQRI